MNKIHLFVKKSFQWFSFSFFIYRYYAIHKEVYNWFNISFDEFGRTSSPQQTDVCQAIFKKLLENNWLSENTMQQVCTYLYLWLMCIQLIIFLLVAGSFPFYSYLFKDSSVVCWYQELKDLFKTCCFTLYNFQIAALLWYMPKVLSWSACGG